MKYGERIKSSVMKKILPPENRSIPEVAREMGISDQTIYNWKKLAEDGKLSLDRDKKPGLFKKVTGLEVKNSELLAGLGVFNAAQATAQGASLAAGEFSRLVAGN